ncbi:MAG: pirin family protein [Candidatus Sumerlaeaceae bacterium]|nr:pirin family protein [Candidatus Sumerlaeaceae bacterium]
MMKKRKAEERGVTELGWLHSRHSFSFGGYHDPEHMGFRALRVLNDDVVEPGGGFGTHPHRDAEIFSYIIDGQLEHRDSMGNGSIIKAGSLQYMSAGSGVMHSEFNPSKTEPVHFLQVWLLPNEQGGKPRYGELDLREAGTHDNGGQSLLSGSGKAGALAIRQDAEVSFHRLAAQDTVGFNLAKGRHGYLHMIKGKLDIQGAGELAAGDALAVSEERSVAVQVVEPAEFLWFDLS